MSTNLIRVAAIALLLLPLCAQGGDGEEADFGAERFSLSGFGTLGEVHSSQDRADFVASVFQPNGAGYTRSWSATVDSLIGAQLIANIAPKLSAVLQIVAQQNYDGAFRPHVEWANIKYQFTPDLSVRIGRAELPTFLFSDTRKVGYTYPWVRPPIEVYGLLPINTSDGAGLSNRVHFGDLTNTTQSSYVQSNTPQPNNRGTALARDSFNISNTSEYKFLTFRVSYQNAYLTITSVDPLLGTFRMFGPQGIGIANKYNSDDKHITTEVIGASYDPGRWFVIGEWGHAQLNSFLGENTAWYVSGGYRTGKFTPYATYAYERAGANSDPGITLVGLPPGLAAVASGLNAGLNALLESTPEQRTVSVGLRWDFMKNLDLKLQADHTRLGAHSYGSLINVQPALQSGGTDNVFSGTIDFVFNADTR